ncbi:carboxypeptidase-like regulatory domain-containing protein [Nonlabens ulvanivorans]|uniref:Carboxypeptidase-like protein n=1 Tax=Nonlabens ulvanivorans TaxID=906888 RepID=A0A084JXU3_NONUL|nr:carboxypeptidase-like regulatory domain-containing protein [Nonlabens ulvanivorans]KEZ93777.1 hypothetical protein IL45_06150 [Nonlabens ulvanivorans]PRX14379.1 carboxypeptidase-like protein [Nonlabens ulvanivorans]
MKHSFFLFLLLYCTTCVAQRTITGNVSDTDGEAILGVTIAIKDSAIGVVSDFDGNYSIVASIEDVLVFSYAGFEPQEILVGSQNTIHVVLEEDLTTVHAIVHYYQKTFEVSTSYGFNYNTVGLGIYKSIWHPLYIDLNASISSDFNINKKFEFSLSRSLSVKSFYFKVGLNHEQADFNFNNFKKNELFFKKNIGRNRDPFQYLKIKLGQLKIQNIELNEHDLGAGIELRKRLISGLYLNSAYTYWNGINEVELKGDYNIRYNWIINVRYHHISNYEEVSLGISYNLRNW